MLMPCHSQARLPFTVCTPRSKREVHLLFGPFLQCYLILLVLLFTIFVKLQLKFADCLYDIRRGDTFLMQSAQTYE